MGNAYRSWACMGMDGWMRGQANRVQQVSVRQRAASNMRLMCICLRRGSALQCDSGCGCFSSRGLQLREPSFPHSRRRKQHLSSCAACAGACTRPAAAMRTHTPCAPARSVEAMRMRSTSGFEPLSTQINSGMHKTGMGMGT